MSSDELRYDRDTAWIHEAAAQSARIAELEAQLEEARAEVERLARINRDLVTSHNTLNLDGARLEAQLTASRSAAEKLAAALGRAEFRMMGVTVFVTSRERIKKPEGDDWWHDALEDVRQALADYQSQDKKEGGK